MNKKLIKIFNYNKMIYSKIFFKMNNNYKMI